MTKEETKQRLAALFAKVEEQAVFNGVVLVAMQGEAVFHEAIGMAERVDGRTRRLTTNSLFELASVSKPITALGIVKLRQMGRLHWDDPIANWMPELPYPGITIRQLLCHTSGLPDYMQLFADVWDPARYAYNEDVLRMLVEHRPERLFAPDESWTYSNTGYVMLAILIERISGQRYDEFLRERIFQPLGMSRTQVYNRRVNPERMPEDYAWGYVYRIGRGGYVLPDEVPELNYVQYLDGLQGDGMVNSTTGDLLRLDRALYDNAFVSPEMRRQLFTPVLTDNGQRYPYGFGWLLEDDSRLGSIVHHTGGWPGYSTVFKRYVDRDCTLIMLQNGERDHAYTQQLVSSIEQILAGEDFNWPAPPKAVNVIPLDPMNAGEQLGEYRFANEAGAALHVQVYVEQDKLYMKLENGMTLTLLPLTATRYYEEQTATELEFVRGDDKEMRLVWHTQEEAEVAERIG